MQPGTVARGGCRVSAWFHPIPQERAERTGGQGTFPRPGFDPGRAGPWALSSHSGLWAPYTQLVTSLGLLVATGQLTNPPPWAPVSPTEEEVVGPDKLWLSPEEGARNHAHACVRVPGPGGGAGDMRAVFGKWHKYSVKDRTAQAERVRPRSHGRSAAEPGFKPPPVWRGALLGPGPQPSRSAWPLMLRDDLLLPSRAPRCHQTANAAKAAWLTGVGEGSGCCSRHGASQLAALMGRALPWQESHMTQPSGLEPTDADSGEHVHTEVRRTRQARGRGPAPSPAGRGPGLPFRRRAEST